MPPTSTKCPLNDNQIRILQYLVGKEDGATNDSLRGAGFSVTNVSVGPLASRSVVVEEDSLCGMGYITREIREGKKGSDTIVWKITKKGVQAASQFRASEQSEEYPRIPASILDPVVKAIKSKRPYGLEFFTDDDIDEIISQCGSAFDHLPYDEVRRQIVNRRKQGAFVEKKDKASRAAKATFKAFGPEGDVVKDFLTTSQLLRLTEMMVD